MRRTFFSVEKFTQKLRVFEGNLLRLTASEFQYSFVINDVFIYLLHHDNRSFDIHKQRSGVGKRLMCQDMR